MRKFDFWMLILFIIALGIMLIFWESENKTSVKNADVSNFWDKYIVIKEYDNMSYGQLYETYDKDTYIRYDIWWTRYHGSITPVYNADGTLMLYEEK